MTIDRFTTKEFEAALPVDSITQMTLWKYAGFEQGERVYHVTIPRKEGVMRIIIRSSIDTTGIAVDSGKDSIRMWLQGYTLEANAWTNVGKGGGSYITRITGWDERMTEKLRELWSLGRKVGICDTHNVFKSVKRVKKETKNQGRIFESCYWCRREGNKKDGFRWLT